MNKCVAITKKCNNITEIRPFKIHPNHNIDVIGVFILLLDISLNSFIILIDITMFPIYQDIYAQLHIW